MLYTYLGRTFILVTGRTKGLFVVAGMVLSPR